MKAEFRVDQEAEFKQCIEASPGCVSQRHVEPPKLVVLTGEHIPDGYFSTQSDNQAD